MSETDVSMWPFVFNFVSDLFNTQTMCDKNVSKAPFMVKYCPDKCNNQEMCDKAVFYLITWLVC